MIPAGVQAGSAKIVGSKGEEQSVVVAMTSGIFNASTGTCYQQCITCDGVTVYSVSADPFGVAVNGQTQERLYGQWNTGNRYDYTSSAAWSSSNTGVATVSSGLVQGVSGGSVNVTGGISGEPVYATYCGEGLYCPVYGGGAGSAPGTVQVPTYFFSPTATHVSQPPQCTQGGATGYFIDVSYYVADANSNRISQSGMTPGENLNDGHGWHDAFATPPTTRADGSFDDTPYGSCYVTSGHFCASCGSQSFRLTVSGIIYPISTSTTSRDCTDGIQEVIEGNPAAQNKTYTFGDTQ